jgi:hypothetical protein
MILDKMHQDNNAVSIPRIQCALNFFVNVDFHLFLLLNLTILWKDLARGSPTFLQRATTVIVNWLAGRTSKNRSIYPPVPLN